MINLIAAVSKNLVIGKNRNLPWKIRKDLEYFKEMTEGHIVVMGKTTYLSLPKGRPLENRYNIVITSTPEIFVERENCIFETLEDFENSIDMLKETGKKIFIIGGGKLYQHFINRCERLYLTYIQ
jgi:dihydrofolate reductase